MEIQDRAVQIEEVRKKGWVMTEIYGKMIEQLERMNGDQTDGDKGGGGSDQSDSSTNSNNNKQNFI